MNPVKSRLRRLLAIARPIFLERRLRTLRKFWEHREIHRGIETIAGKKILLLSPHPDDESIGCGGTLALLARKDSEIHVAYLTDGEKGIASETSSPEQDRQTAAMRQTEARRACEILGVKRIFFFSRADGRLHLDFTAEKELGGLLRREKYDAVFCPWPYDLHTDHSATFSIFAQALANHAAPLRVWLYEVWNPLLINHAVDITATVEEKLRAIRAHESQVALKDYAEISRSLAQYRSVHHPGAVYAEAFFVAGHRELLKLTRSF